MTLLSSLLGLLRFYDLVVVFFSLWFLTGFSLFFNSLLLPASMLPTSSLFVWGAVYFPRLSSFVPVACFMLVLDEIFYSVSFALKVVGVALSFYVPLFYVWCLIYCFYISCLFVSMPSSLAVTLLR